MAHKKGLGSSRNGRDSPGQRLGVKVFAGEVVTGGEIIVRPRGSRFHAGEGGGRGRGDPRAPGEVAPGGQITARPRGSRSKAGEGVGMGRDDTLFARAAGTVQFS